MGRRGNHKQAGKDDPNTTPFRERTDDSHGETSPCHHRHAFQLFFLPKQTQPYELYLCKLITSSSFYSLMNPTPAALQDSFPCRSFGQCSPSRAGACITTWLTIPVARLSRYPALWSTEQEEREMLFRKIYRRLENTGYKVERDATGTRTGEKTPRTELF